MPPKKKVVAPVTNPDKRLVSPIEVETHVDSKGRPQYADIANLGMVEVETVSTSIPGMQVPERGAPDYGDQLGPSPLITKHTTQLVRGSLVDETGMRLLGTDGWHPFRRDPAYWTKVVHWNRYLVTEETYQRVNG